MGLITRAFNPNISINQLDEALDRLVFGQETSAGVAVQESSLITEPTAYACQNLISSDISRQPLNLYEQRPDGSKREAYDHPIYRLLKVSPNPAMTPTDFWRTFLHHILGWGNGYAFIQRRERDRRPVALWPRAPSRIEVGVDGNSQRKYIFHTANQGPVSYTQDQIFHVPGMGFDGMIGYSPIMHWARETIASAIATQKYSSKFFSSGARPFMAIKHPSGFKTKDEEDDFLKRWKQNFAGVDSAYGTALLPQGMELEPIPSMPSNEAQLLELKRFDKEQILMIYRVPRHMAQDLNQSIKANFAEQSLDYVKFTLSSWVIAIEQAVNKWLLPPSEQGRYFAKFNLDALLRADIKTRTEVHKTEINWGLKTVNEIRAQEDLNPVTGGDVRWMPLNMVPVGDDGQPLSQDMQRALMRMVTFMGTTELEGVAHE